METSVVVVHGIGDPLPGNALEKLVQGLSAADWQQVEGSWVETRHEKEQLGLDDREVKTFPVARATLERTENSQMHRLHLREVYWGDISRQKASLFGLISAVFDLIFGLRYIVAAATSQTTGVANIAGKIAGAALWWIRGPMFALNILAMAIAGLYVWFSTFNWSSYVSAPIVAGLCGSLLMIVAGYFVCQFARRLEWSSDTGVCLTLLSACTFLLSIGLCLLGEHDAGALVGRPERMNWDISSIMLVGAFSMAILVLAYFLLCAWSWFKSKELRKPIVVIAFCTGLSLALFTFVIIALWIVFGKAIRESNADRIARCAPDLWPYADHCITSDLWETVGTRLADRIEMGIHQLPLLVICLATLGLVFLGVALKNYKLRKNREMNRYRYIVNPWAVSLLVVGSGGFAFIFAWYCIAIFYQLSQDQGEGQLFGYATLVKLKDLLGENGLKSFAIALSAGVVSIVIASRSHFLFAMDLILDVIMHFRVNDYEEEKSNVSWNRTVNRFRQVLDCELAKDGGARRVVVVAHSLGSAISADGLGALEVVGVSEQSEVKPAYSRVSFVTMGNPIINLLKFYLPDRYRLHPGAVCKWFNIYRIDDFVGTKLDVDQVCERNVGLGGHTDYWSDPRVVPGLIEAIHHAQNCSETIQSELDIKPT